MSSDRSIVLVGGGGHCRSVFEVATGCGLAIEGVLDLPGSLPPLPEVKVLGDDSMMESLVPDHLFVITLGQIGRATARQRLAAMLDSVGARCAVICAHSALVSSTARIGDGTVILQGAIVNACASVGRHCIINTGAIIEHDAIVGDFCHVSTGAIVNGGATIGPGVMIGSHATVLQGATICAGAIIGAGAVVVGDITEPGTYVGVPARQLDR